MIKNDTARKGEDKEPTVQEDLVEKYRIPVGNDEITYVNICMNCTGYQGITSAVRIWSSSLGYRNKTADDIIKREIERLGQTGGGGPVAHASGASQLRGGVRGGEPDELASGVREG